MKTIWKFLSSKFVWINVLVAVVLVLVAAMAVLFSLNRFTLQGQEIEVPQLEGMYVAEAELALRNSGLAYEVVDSVYMRGHLPGEIIDQVPAAHSHVKLGRKIYLTINAKSHKMLPLPDLTNFPSRQARATLEAYGFVVDRVSYVPSEFPDLVVKVLAGGASVSAGTQLPDGAHVELVVGEKTAGASAYTPNLRGLSEQSARSYIIENQFVVGAVEYDEKPESVEARADFFVYRQTPVAGSTYATGHRIDIWLTRDPQKMAQPSETKSSVSDEDFFE